MIKGMLLVLALCASFPRAQAQQIEELLAGVVKIRSQAEDGQRRTGTGVVVAINPEAITLLTAAHVVEGDREPEVEFHAARGERVSARVLQIEGGDARGLAILRVPRAKSPKTVTALSFAKARPELTSVVTVIGFPMGGADWSVVMATLSGWAGRDMTLDGNINEGNSGGPALLRGEIVGIITGTTGFARATPSSAVVDLLGNWGVAVTSAAGPSSPQGAADALKVVEAQLRAEPNNYRGTCPVTITFTGRVSAVGSPGRVSYRVARSDAALGQIVDLPFEAPGSKDVSTAWTLGAPGMSFSGWMALQILEPQQQESNRAAFTITCDSGPGTANTVGTCIQGYVWRDAFPGDKVCVLPNVRSQAAYDNSQASARRMPGGGASGPDTCRQGFVWREAGHNDHVCVKPETREQVRRDNQAAVSRVAK